MTSTSVVINNIESVLDSLNLWSSLSKVLQAMDAVSPQLGSSVPLSDRYHGESAMKNWQFDQSVKLQNLQCMILTATSIIP